MSKVPTAFLDDDLFRMFTIKGSEFIYITKNDEDEIFLVNFQIRGL